MPLAGKKAIKCPLCGAKNDSDARRCSICTRPLADDGLETQNQYNDALWSTQIAHKRHKKRPRSAKYVVMLISVLVGLGANYFTLKLGPPFMHQAPERPLDADFREFQGQPLFVADLPGVPMAGEAISSGTTLATSTVWVDGGWKLLRDDDTSSEYALDFANKNVHATLTVGAGPAPEDVAASLPAIVSAIGGNAVIEPSEITRLEQPAYGEQYTLRTTFREWPEPFRSGVVRANAVELDGQLYVAVSYIIGGDDPALHDRLGSTFSPRSILEK